MAMKKSLFTFALVAFTGLDILVIASANSDTLYRNLGNDLSGNPTYSDSEGTNYQHGAFYDPNGAFGYTMYGSDGSTLYCQRGLGSDSCTKN